MPVPHPSLNLLFVFVFLSLTLCVTVPSRFAPYSNAAAGASCQEPRAPLPTPQGQAQQRTLRRAAAGVCGFSPKF